MRNYLLLYFPALPLMIEVVVSESEFRTILDSLAWYAQTYLATDSSKRDAASLLNQKLFNDHEGKDIQFWTPSEYDDLPFPPSDITPQLLSNARMKEAHMSKTP